MSAGVAVVSVAAPAVAITATLASTPSPISPPFASQQRKVLKALRKLRASREAYFAAQNSGAFDEPSLQRLEQSARDQWEPCHLALCTLLFALPKTLADSDLQLEMLPVWDEVGEPPYWLRSPRTRTAYFRKRLLARLAAEGSAGVPEQTT
jgi:hypothetical protein